MDQLKKLLIKGAASPNGPNLPTMAQTNKQVQQPVLNQSQAQAQAMMNALGLVKGNDTSGA